jgi:hypothetical protein
MATIELDIINVLSREAEVELELQYGIELMLITENGPAGGNPLYSVQGNSTDIIKFLKEWYYGPDFGTEAFIMGEIKAVYSNLFVS